MCGQAAVLGKALKGPRRLLEHIDPFCLLIGGGPLGQTSTNHILMAYPKKCLHVCVFI